jgi:histidine triad (HIT) family protein
MDDCIFCKIIRGEIPSTRIYENAAVYAFLDIKPTNPGHTLVIPRKHHENVYATPDETLVEIARTAKMLAIAIKKAVNADGINLIMNNDPAAGQLVFHAHLHIVPRFAQDGFRHWSGKSYGAGEMEAVAEKIKIALEP